MHTPNFSGVDSVPSVGIGTTLGVTKGNNLKFHQNTERIFISIITEAGATTKKIYIWDFKMTPLYPNFNVGGVIDSLNIANVWLRNRNIALSDIKLKQDIEKYFLPYGSKVNVNLI